MSFENLEIVTQIQNLGEIKECLESEKSKEDKGGLRTGLMLLVVCLALASVIYFFVIPKESTGANIFYASMVGLIVVILFIGVVLFCVAALSSRSESEIVSEVIITKLINYSYTHHASIKALKDAIKYAPDGSVRIKLGDAFKVVDMELIEVHRKNSAITKQIEKQLSALN